MIDIISPYGGGKQYPKKIIVHAMAEYIKYDGTVLHASALLTELKLSAHILITPRGEEIRMRYDHDVAYHARGHNQDSLGIEFLVPGEHDYGSFINTMRKPYLKDKQLEVGVAHCEKWINTYQINQIDRHSDIDPKRKKDPGEGFPWNIFLDSLGVELPAAR